jgi:hypothetical protein
MKKIIVLSLVLLTCAGIIAIRQLRASKAPQQAIKTLTNASNVEITKLNINGNSAEFKLLNHTNEKLTAVTVSSGINQTTMDISFFNRNIEPNRSMFVNLEVGKPIVLEAVIYESGKAEGNEAFVQKILDAREGHRIAMEMIVQAAGGNLSMQSLKVALTNVQLNEGAFRSRSVWYGANAARNRLASMLSRIESEKDSRIMQQELIFVVEWMKSQSKKGESMNEKTTDRRRFPNRAR